MPCYAIDGVIPVVSPEAYVHPTAVLIGDVIIEAGAYIGPLAALRADFGRIHVMQDANIQDSCVVHGFPNYVTLIEERGHVGHAAVLHSCRVGKNALIGMNSVILDFAEIGENSIVGANSLVKTKAVIPANMLAMGSPAKVIRALSEQELIWKNQGTEEYIQLTQRCKNSMVEVQPLTQQDAGRKTHLDFQSAHQIKPQQ